MMLNPWSDSPKKNKEAQVLLNTKLFLAKKDQPERFSQRSLGRTSLSILHPFYRTPNGIADPVHPLFWVKNIPNLPFHGAGDGTTMRGWRAFFI